MQIHPDIAATAAEGLYRETARGRPPGSPREISRGRSQPVDAFLLASALKGAVGSPDRHVGRPKPMIAVVAVGCPAESPSPSQLLPGLEVPEILDIAPPPGGGNFGPREDECPVHPTQNPPKPRQDRRLCDPPPVQPRI